MHDPLITKLLDVARKQIERDLMLEPVMLALETAAGKVGCSLVRDKDTIRRAVPAIARKFGARRVAFGEVLGERSGRLVLTIYDCLADGAITSAEVPIQRFANAAPLLGDLGPFRAAGLSSRLAPVSLAIAKPS